MSMSKAHVFSGFREHLQALLTDLTRARDAARAGTQVDGVHRPENRGERAAVTAQGYLTAGLAAREAEIQGYLDALALIDPGPRTRGAPGALLHTENDAAVRHWFAVLPGGQGARVRAGKDEVTVVSPGSPLGRVLIGAAPGDVVEAPRAGELEILEVL